MPGAARRPAGDLVQFDVAREAANGVLERLRQLDLHRVGSIAVDRIDTALSDVAAAAEAHAPGEPSEAVIWEEVEARVRGDSGLSPSFVALLVIAVLIGAVGVLVDSPILIVGAMVVGPEYGPLASVAMGLYGCRLRRVRRGLVALAVGFPVAIVAAASLTVVLRWADRIPVAYRLGERPLTNFISNPDLFAMIVAVLAGVAGTVVADRGPQRRIGWRSYLRHHHSSGLERRRRPRHVTRWRSGRRARSTDTQSRHPCCRRRRHATPSGTAVAASGRGFRRRQNGSCSPTRPKLRRLELACRPSLAELTGRIPCSFL